MMSMPGSRASTSDCSTSKLVPMPPHISSGVPVPSPALTSTRNCWRQTVTCRVVLGFEVFGTTAAGDGSGSLFGPSRTPDHGFTGPPTTAVPTGVTVTVPTFPRAELSHAQPPMRIWFRPGNRPSTGCSPARACGGRTDGNDLSPRVARSLPACRRPERMRDGKNRFLPGNSRENHQVKSGREALSRCRGPSGGGVGPSRLLHSALLRQHSRRALVKLVRLDSPTAVGSVPAGGAGHAVGDRVDHLVLTGIPATRTRWGPTTSALRSPW